MEDQAEDVTIASLNKIPAVARRCWRNLMNESLSGLKCARNLLMLLDGIFCGDVELQEVDGDVVAKVILVKQAINNIRRRFVQE